MFSPADASGKKSRAMSLAPMLPRDLTSVEETAFGGSSSESYRSLRGTFNCYQLVVGAGFSETQELGGLALTSFLGGSARQRHCRGAGAVLATRCSADAGHCPDHGAGGTW